jgi:hypothetical protein
VKTKFEPQYRQSPSFDRRSFLGALGAGALSFGGSAFMGDAWADFRRDGRNTRRFFLSEDNFGRIFPRLPAFFGDTPAKGLNEALLKIGMRGGVLDANDQVPASPDPAVQAQAAINLIVDPALNVNNPNNTTHTAGTTFMGQFMDHDMTFDQTSALGEETEPEDSPNTRSPTLDLDSRLPDQVQDRFGRPVRGPAPRQRRHGHHRRSP